MITSFQILGNSAGMPARSRNVSSLMVSTANFDIMLDCGEGTYLAWRKTGYKWKHLKYIFITHLHPDHVSGLVPLLFYRKLLSIETPLVIYGPDRLEKLVKNSVNDMNIHLNYELSIRSVSVASEFELEGGISVKTAEMEHKIPCYGYRLKNGDKKNIVFITDTRPCENALVLADHAHILIHEATFADENVDMAHNHFHTTIHQALDNAEKAQVKRLYLTHFSPKLDNARLDRIRFNGWPVISKGKISLE